MSAILHDWKRPELDRTLPHGQRWVYVKGCRCRKCTTAEATYRRDYRKRKKELWRCSSSS